VASHNGSVRRLIFFAIGLSLLWTTAARAASVPLDRSTSVSEVGSCLMAGGSHDAGDSDQQWQAQHYTVAAGTGSLWKSTQAHADLASTPSARVVETARVAGSSAPPIGSPPHYLRHTPLLI
jgi:hypothetical protein